MQGISIRIPDRGVSTKVTTSLRTVCMCTCVQESRNQNPLKMGGLHSSDHCVRSPPYSKALRGIPR